MKDRFFWKVASVAAFGDCSTWGMAYINDQPQHGTSFRPHPLRTSLRQPRQPIGNSFGTAGSNLGIAARFKVPGGWLVTVRDGGGVTFILIAKHEWQIADHSTIHR